MLSTELRLQINHKTQEIPPFRKTLTKMLFLSCEQNLLGREILSAYKKSQKPLGRNVAALVFCSENVITDLFTLTVDHDSAGDNRLAY